MRCLPCLRRNHLAYSSCTMCGRDWGFFIALTTNNPRPHTLLYHLHLRSLLFLHLADRFDPKTSRLWALSGPTQYRPITIDTVLSCHPHGFTWWHLPVSELLAHKTSPWHRSLPPTLLLTRGHVCTRHCNSLGTHIPMCRHGGGYESTCSHPDAAP